VTECQKTMKWRHNHDKLLDVYWVLMGPSQIFRGPRGRGIPSATAGGGQFQLFGVRAETAGLCLQ
jgi:hypothetical protein